MPVFLVAGGTGQVGSACVRALSAAGVIVKVLSRDPSVSKAQSLTDLPGVTIVKGDYSDGSSLVEALEGVEATFLGCSNFEGQVEAEKNFIDRAVESGSCRYLVKLGTCGAAGYTAKDSLIQYGRYHAEIEEHLAQQASLQWTVLRPNDFMQNHMGDIFGTLPLGIVAYPLPNDSEATVVDARDVGDLAAKLMLATPDYEKHAGKVYDVCGPTPIHTQALATMYTDALKRPIVPVTTTPEEWASNAEKAGFPAWLAKAVCINFTEFWAKGELNYPSSSEVLEVCAPKRTMEMWVAEHAPLSPPPAS